MHASGHCCASAVTVTGRCGRRIATPASIQPSPPEQRTKPRRRSRLPRSAAEDETAARAAVRAESGRGHASRAGLALSSTDRGGQGGEQTHRLTEAVSAQQPVLPLLQ
eukprot:161508-Chlamydomonas_euryale.AAC.1